MPLEQVIQLVTGSSDLHFPVVALDGRMTGILSINDIRPIMFDESQHQIKVAKDVAAPEVVRVLTEDSLQDALDKMILMNVDELPVVQAEDPEKIVGMISKKDIIGYYHEMSRK